jgi:hypothetical protein
MAFCGQNHIQCKLVMISEITEQTHRFSYLGCEASRCWKMMWILSLEDFRKYVELPEEHLNQKH